MAAAALLAVWPQAAAAAELDEILERHITARGGAERLQAVADARVTGTMSPAPGLEYPFVLEWQRPDRVRLELVVDDEVGVRAFDGEVAWSHMPFLGEEQPERLPAQELESMKGIAGDLFAGPLVGYREKGHRVELVGRERLDARDAHHLSLRLASGEELELWLGVEHHLVLQQRSQAEVDGEEIEVITVFGDYREVEGLVLPFTYSTRLEGAPSGVSEQTLTIESYRFDVGLEEGRFAVPGSTPDGPPPSVR